MVKIKVSAELAPSGEAPDENLFLLSSSFWRLLAFLGLWPHHSNLCSKLCSVSSHCLFRSEILSCLPLGKALVISRRAHPDNSGPPPHLKILRVITSTWFLSQITRHMAQATGAWTWTSSGANIQPPALPLMCCLSKIACMGHTHISNPFPAVGLRPTEASF